MERTLLSVTQSCFFTKDALSAGFVCRWLEQHAPRIILPLHRYCVHTITTVYRRFENEVNHLENFPNDDVAGKASTSQRPSNADDSDDAITIVAGQQKISLELATPVLDNVKSPFSSCAQAAPSHRSKDLMPLSQAWLLAGSLPALYTRPQQSSVHKSDQQQSKGSAQQPKQELEHSNSSIGLRSLNNNLPNTTNAVSNTFMNRLLSLVPSHWTLLYDSNQHGVGSNRFLHHVLGYRGPTLSLIHSDGDEVFCIAAAGEWRDTHLYTGDKDCQIMQLLPK